MSPAHFSIRFVWLNLLSLVIAISASSATYDPLLIDSEFTPRMLDLDVSDATRDRIIPLRLYLPENTTAAPVVLFSHGLGGSRKNNSYLGTHWSRRGYVVVFTQHIGSDESIWKNTPANERFDAIQAAANYTNAKLRYEDIPVVLDQLQLWQHDANSPLYRRMDLEHIGMSGHSFGAVTTQGVSGQQFLMGLRDYTDPRIDAALAMSPSSPRRGRPARAFGSVGIPWLLMTGTLDTSPIGRGGIEARLKVFPALPAGDKYELVLYQAQHSAFGERPIRLGEARDRNPKHHIAILAISTAYWDAYLKQAPDAHSWLTSDHVRSVLEPQDRWQWK